MRARSRRIPPPTAAQHIQPPPETGQGSLQAGQVRVRQHLNPLARRWSQPVNLPTDWYAAAFGDVTSALTVDVGVAKGRFLHKLARENPSRNFLGLEIREPLVHQANRAAAHDRLGNLFFVACNANVSLRDVLRAVPSGVLRDVYVQFCDPWFKKRHAKRRMVNPPLVDDIFQALRLAHAHAQASDGDSRSVFVQSDVVEVAVQMRTFFEQHGGFVREDRSGVVWNQNGWLVDNPIGLPTEREIAVLNKGGQVYRALYTLNHEYQDAGNVLQT